MLSRLFRRSENLLINEAYGWKLKITGLSFVNKLSNSRSDKPCGCSVSGINRNRSTTFTNRIFKSEHLSRRIATPARASAVWITPAHKPPRGWLCPALFRRGERWGGGRG